MASQSWITTLAFIAMAATPVFAQDGHHRRATEQRDQPRQEQPNAQQAAPAGRDRAVPRTVEPRRDQQVRQQEQVRQHSSKPPVAVLESPFEIARNQRAHS